MGRDILLIGIGQTGCAVAELFSNKMNKDGIRVTSLAMDTDETVLEKLASAKAVPMTDEKDIFSVVEALGAENVKDWFPCEWDEDCTEFAKILKMNAGSNQWRMKAYLSFASFLSKDKTRAILTETLDSLIESCDSEKGIEVYTVASLAGGTGSALFLPVALYVKKYIESKNAKISMSTAMLAMPDIYENCYSAEQRVKSQANAYAALREYNAMLLSTCYAVNEEKGEFHPPVVFKLGKENGTPELLFDSEKEEYKVPSANPFDRVYLLERVAGVMSASEHMDIIADVTASVCKGGAWASADADKKEKKSDAVFRGISLVNIKYPLEYTVNYIAKKQLNDLVMRELSRTYRSVEAEIERKSGEALLYGYHFKADIEQYAELFVSVAEDIVAYEGNDLSLIARKPDKFVGDKSAVDVWTPEYRSRLGALIDSRLLCDASKNISAVLTATDVDEKSKKKTKAKAKPADTAALARDCGEWLRDTFRHGLEAGISRKQELIDSLLNDNADDETFSILGSIIKKDGKYLHPVYALLRLCVVYNELVRSYNLGYSLSGYAAEEIAKAEVPEELLIMKPSESSRTKYAKAGELRFLDLVSDKTGKQIRKADDRLLFKEDLATAYDNVMSILRFYHYVTVIDTVGSMISAYRSFFSYACAMEDDIESDVKLALICGSSDNGNCVNVGVSVSEKERHYTEYAKKYFERTECIEEYTKTLGRLVYEGVRTKSDDSSFRGTAEKVFETAEKIYKKQCTDSEYYRSDIDRNILDIVLDKRSGVSLSLVFKGRNATLRTKMPQAYSEYKDVKCETVAVLDREVETFIKENPDRFSGIEPKTYVEQLMYRAGEYSGSAAFADNVGAKNMLLRTECVNLRAYFAETVNELSDEHTGYKNYQKALREMVAYTTKMWNPHLTYSRDGEKMLPFINPEMQKGYEADVAKAVVYAIHTGDVFVDKVNGEKVFFIRRGLLCEPLMMGENTVGASEPDKLMELFYATPSLTRTYAKDFDKTVRDETKRVPAQGISGSNRRAVTRAINRFTSTAMIRQTLVCLIADLIAAERFSEGGYALRLAELGYSMLEGFCRKGFSETDEHYIAIYNRQINAVAEALLTSKGYDLAEKTLNKLNSFGFFMSYDIAGRLCDYNYGDRPAFDDDDVTDEEELIGEDGTVNEENA